MSNAKEPSPTPQESRAVWDRIAGFWDDYLKDGNDFQRELIMPATGKLLEIQPGQSVLDACCGNGNYSRRLGRAGAKVVAFDGAEVFVERAKLRTTSEDGQIEYHVADATDESQILALGGEFDAAACSMAVMDLPTIEPLFRAIHKLLKPDGRFVFSISHPCFNSLGSHVTAELINEDGQLRQEFGMKISNYRDERPFLSYGILNQPEPHFNYHRTIGTLVETAVSAGFVVDAVVEPAFPDDKGAKSAFSWAKRPKIPPALVMRVRPKSIQ
jgi:SAM-dependent methyltransferase